jgi:hypothetical protein
MGNALPIQLANVKGGKDALIELLVNHEASKYLSG